MTKRRMGNLLQWLRKRRTVSLCPSSVPGAAVHCVELCCHVMFLYPSPRCTLLAELAGLACMSPRGRWMFEQQSHSSKQNRWMHVYLNPDEIILLKSGKKKIGVMYRLQSSAFNQTALVVFSCGQDSVYLTVHQRLFIYIIIYFFSK